MYKSASESQAYLTRAGNHSVRMSGTGETPVSVPWLPDAVSLQEHVRRKRSQIERLRHTLAEAAVSLAATGGPALRERLDELEKMIRVAEADVISVAGRVDRLADLSEAELFFEVCRENLTKDVFLPLMDRTFARLDVIRERNGAPFVALEVECADLRLIVNHWQERRKEILDHPGARTRRRQIIAEDPDVREIDRRLEEARARLRDIKPALRRDRERVKAAEFQKVAERELPSRLLDALEEAALATWAES